MNTSEREVGGAGAEKVEKLWTRGYRERLLRSVETPLRKVLGHALFTGIELGTVLSEIEAMVTVRPLTFVSDDPKDLNALTPFHFLTGRELKGFSDLCLKFSW
ncbi:hypothetical protein M514_27358 [Trichuris suis]|uniref:Uncharacterized protein n=1 Tax=Trichuris suis TaxID=68888 RepID=A0A085MTD2_9BILA|nr:hypothetical protein M514_27358 [Trichuris suis]